MTSNSRSSKWTLSVRFPQQNASIFHAQSVVTLILLLSKYCMFYMPKNHELHCYVLSIDIRVLHVAYI
jgi:hypothetical protein